MDSFFQPLPISDIVPLSDHFEKSFKNIVRLCFNEKTGCKIYKAEHKIDGKLYAIKKIGIPKEFETYSQKHLDHYINEVKILTRFDHPNIVKYHYCWIEKEELKNDKEKLEISRGDQSQAFSFESEKKTTHFLYIQMEYCPGGSLAAYILQKEVTPQKAKRIFIQILQGMEQVHSQNIIHRDLKPENIFVNEEGNKVKIGDFGLSLLHDFEADGGSDRSKSQSKEQIQSKVSQESSSDLKFSEDPSSICSKTDNNTKIVGTPLYCSPEQQAGRKYGKETDIFALGLIFYQILAFPKATHMEKSQLFASLREQWDLASDFESKFPLEADIIKRMAYFYPSKRAKIEEVLSKLNGPVEKRLNISLNANLIKKR